MKPEKWTHNLRTFRESVFTTNYEHGHTRGGTISYPHLGGSMSYGTQKSIKSNCKIRAVTTNVAVGRLKGCWISEDLFWRSSSRPLSFELHHQEFRLRGRNDQAVNRSSDLSSTRKWSIRLVRRQTINITEVWETPYLLAILLAGIRGGSSLGIVMMRCPVVCDRWADELSGFTSSIRESWSTWPFIVTRTYHGWTSASKHSIVKKLSRKQVGYFIQK